MKSNKNYMKHLTEKQLADYIATIIVFVIVGLEVLIKLIAKILWRFKRLEIKIFCILMGLLLVMSLKSIVYSPVTVLAMNAPTIVHTSQ